MISLTKVIDEKSGEFFKLLETYLNGDGKDKSKLMLLALYAYVNNKASEEHVGDFKIEP